MEFRRLGISDRAYYEDFFNAKTAINDSYVASELNFSNLFCWNVSDNIWYYPDRDAIYLKSVWKDEVYFLPPLVKRDEDFAPALGEIETYFKRIGRPFVVRSLTKEMLDVLGEAGQAGYEIAYNRDYSEYLYDTGDLMHLTGKKYAPKRNHLNAFYASYDTVFRPFETGDRQGIINLVQEWKVYTGNTEILEQAAIDNAVAYYGELGLKCDVIEADGKIIAFSIGFVNRNNVGIVMFEKADANYRGSFPAINNLFVKQNFTGCRLVNRQEDMGIEGLRKAKLSYHPVAMADKYDITLKG